MIKFCDLVLTVSAGQIPWGRGESNPYWLEPKSTTQRGTAGELGKYEQPRGGSRQLRHQRATVRTQSRTHAPLDSRAGLGSRDVESASILCVPGNVEVGEGRQFHCSQRAARGTHRRCCRRARQRGAECISTMICAQCGTAGAPKIAC
jgi:hypothetical protein